MSEHYTKIIRYNDAILGHKKCLHPFHKIYKKVEKVIVTNFQS